MLLCISEGRCQLSIPSKRGVVLGYIPHNYFTYVLYQHGHQGTHSSSTVVCHPILCPKINMVAKAGQKSFHIDLMLWWFDDNIINIFRHVKSYDAKQY